MHLLRPSTNSVHYQQSEYTTTANPVQYAHKEKANIAVWGAVFKVLTDTVAILLPNGRQAYHLPFTYDFEDPFGEQDWTKMFVTKLLATKKGNCHSLPYLYKILCEELGVSAIRNGNFTHADPSSYGYKFHSLPTK